MPDHIDEDELASPVPPPGLREAVVAEGRRRLRARRRAARILGVVGAASLAAALAVVPRGSEPDNRVRAAQSPDVTTVPLPAPSPVPELLVVATAGGTGRPGDIQVLSATDGSVIRTLAQAYQPYPMSGLTLSPDGRFAYFVRLLEAEQRFEIARVNTQGGPVEHVAFGTRQTFEPSGRRMAYVSDRDRRLVVLDLATGVERSFAMGDVPEVARGELIGSLHGLAWLDDGSRLAVLTSKPGPNGREGCSRMACPTTTTLAPTSPTCHVLTFDPESAGIADADVRSCPVGTEWTFLARGPESGTMVVAGTPVDRQADQAPSVSLIEVGSPERPARALVTLPPSSFPLSLDPSGQHLLFGGQGFQLFHRSILEDTPPARLGGDEYINASW